MKKNNKYPYVHQFNLKKELKDKKEEIVKDILKDRKREKYDYNFQVFIKYNDYLYDLFIKSQYFFYPE